ncbi:SH3 domain-containing protein [Succiniclasticum ruminis]|uniref:SH3 domain-containing protein n=1 Tax=Succiniclasticum ruminis DSM 9236 TaxID=1123323 RepID=A0A1I2A3A5_9FIRM|nr:SH3 domain-containing protein [Succiniclasticum ruminis]SFE38257.1 SH3 domain-containing protein [Succiniclasticum ruminis DSM 9236]
MRRMRNLFSMILLLVCLLVTVSAWAMPPEDGIYEKKDGSGNVTGRMFIITLRGKASETQEGFTMETSPGAPIIAMQALDGNGNVTEELATCYSWKTDTAGAGETGIRLRGETLQNAMQKYKKFTPEVFSTAFGQQVEFGFVNEGRANAYNCSDALNGEYVRNSSATNYYPLSVLLFVYEKTLNSQAFLNRGIAANTYSLSDEQEAGPWHGDYYVLNVSNQDRQDMWTVTAEKNLRIVMENHNRDYHFLFVRNNYHGDPSWVGITWGAFTGEAMTSVNALYLHRHITVFAPEMLENPDTFIRLTDFYSGEGPDAVTTNAMAVLVPEGNDTMRLGHANISDTGTIQFYKEMGRAEIKGEGVRIREEPNTNCAILGEKDTGYPLTVLGFVKEPGEKYGTYKWAKVQLDDGTVGYVSGQFIRGIDTPFD